MDEVGVKLRHSMHRRWPLATLLTALLATAAGGARAEPLTIVCGAVPETLKLCNEGATAWAKARGQEVRILAYPSSTARSRALLGELLAAGVPDLDVVEIDIVWPAALAPDLIDLGPELGEPQQAFFASAMQSFTVDGHLVAVPWFLGVGQMFYRSDLLAKYGMAPPATWEELANAGRQVQESERAAGNAEIWGYLGQGRVGEGLTVNALEWLMSAGAPPLLAEDGTPMPDSPKAATALGQAVSWIGTISPGAVLDMDGSDSVAAFLKGQAVFLRYWSNGKQLMERSVPELAGKIGSAPMPAGSGLDGRSAAVLGGFGLAVSRHSRQPKLAADLVRYLTSAEEQKRRALADGVDPSRPALYADPDLLAARPDYPALRTALDQAIVRPAAAAHGTYEQLSRTFAEGVHRVLAREIEPAAGVAEIAASLRRVLPGRPRSGS